MNDQAEIGLGLSISKQIVRLFGGDIEFTSEVNKGSCFSFFFEMEELLSENQSTESNRSNWDGSSSGKS